MNNVPGNIQLSQAEDDKLSLITSETAIKNAKAQLAKMPKADSPAGDRTKAARRKLEHLIDANTKVMTAARARLENSYVANGTAGTWDGKEATATNPDANAPTTGR